MMPAIKWTSLKFEFLSSTLLDESVTTLVIFILEGMHIVEKLTLFFKCHQALHTTLLYTYSTTVYSYYKHTVYYIRRTYCCSYIASLSQLLEKVRFSNFENFYNVHKHDLLGLKNRRFCPVENDRTGRMG